MITAVRNKKYVTRNTSLFKKITGQQVPDDDYESDSLDDDEEDDNPEIAAPQVNPALPPNPAQGRCYPAREKRSVHRYGQNVYEQ